MTPDRLDELTPAQFYLMLRAGDKDADEEVKSSSFKDVLARSKAIKAEIAKKERRERWRKRKDD